MSKIERALRKAEEEKKRRAEKAFTTDRNGEAISSVEMAKLEGKQIRTPRCSEYFRKMSARLKTCSEQMGVTDIIFTSAVSDEGKTTAAVNCALSLCRDFNQSVCLIDCDLRNPSISDRLSLNGSMGIVDLLNGTAEIDSVIKSTAVAGLSVITSRRTGISSLPLLSSERMSRVIRNLKSRFDFVLFDSPPVLPVADAAVLAKQVSAIVLVIESGRTRKKHVEQIFEQIDRNKVIGFVMNYKRHRMPETYNYSKYYDYGEKTQ